MKLNYTKDEVEAKQRMLRPGPDARLCDDWLALNAEVDLLHAQMDELVDELVAAREAAEAE